MALTSAEKLHVINTPRAKFIREILAEYFSEETMGSPSLPWDKSRGSDFRCIAQAVYSMERWPTSRSATPLKTAGSLPQVEKWLNSGKDKKTVAAATDIEEGAGVPDAFAKKVRETYSLMVQMAMDEKLSAPFTSYQKVCVFGSQLVLFAHGPPTRFHPSR